MLPAKNRLTKEGDFKRVYTSGRSFFSSSIRLKTLPNHLAVSRAAVVVSTKVSKKATKRNKLKRQLREIIRLNFKKLNSGHDIVVSVQPQALKIDFEQLEKDLLGLLKKARILK